MSRGWNPKHLALFIPLMGFVGISFLVKFWSSLFADLLLPTKKRDAALDPTPPSGNSPSTSAPCSRSSSPASTPRPPPPASDANMWKCHKCGKPVYFAERKTSLGYDWHPECLRCEECAKRLNPGQHAEHKGMPYCYIPCYGALFGPQLYGHGSRVESHTSFGTPKISSQGEKGLLEIKLKEYNAYHELKSQSNVVQCRERNGKLILEGSLRIYWDISEKLRLKEEHDNRILVVRRKSSYIPRNRPRPKIYIEPKDDDEPCSPTSEIPSTSSSSTSTSTPTSSPEEPLSPDELGRNYKTLPAGGLKAVMRDMDSKGSKSFDEYFDFEEKEGLNEDRKASLCVSEAAIESSVTLRRCNLRRSKAKLRRRCSINGHFYNRETCVFTPASGSVTSVWVSSLVNTTEVINMLLDKFKVTNQPQDFALFIIRDTGEVRRIQEHENPLITRVLLGPNEEAARVFILNDKQNEISSEVAQYLNLSHVELQMFLRKFEEEEMKEVERIKRKFEEAKKYIKLRIKELEAKPVVISVRT